MEERCSVATVCESHLNLDYYEEHENYMQSGIVCCSIVQKLSGRGEGDGQTLGRQEVMR